MLFGYTTMREVNEQFTNKNYLKKKNLSHAKSFSNSVLKEQDTPDV